MTHNPRWLLLALLAALLLAAGCASTRPPAPGASSASAGRYLFVWAGDAQRADPDPDFLAVLDADPASPGYGSVVTTLAVDAAGTHPHHTDHQMPADGVLWANGFGSGDVFRFNLRDPRHPRLAGRFVIESAFMHPHSFARLEDGRVLATLQMRGHDNAEAGALVALDAEGHVVREAPAADPDTELFIRPYSLAVIPALDRVVTTSADMHAAEPSHVVQVWRLDDLSRVATVRLPPGPRGDEGVDPADVSDPDHPREAGRLTLAETNGPHWIALDPTGTRIVISGGGGTLLHRVLLADLDPATGALALDVRFRDAGADAPGVTFDRAAWPHGATGPAVPHGAVFSLTSYE